MNQDTINTVEDIRRKQWYNINETMGKGGWEEVRKFATGWKTYSLNLPGGERFEFVAKNDNVARRACGDLFNLTDNCRLVEKVVKFRSVSLKAKS